MRDKNGIGALMRTIRRADPLPILSPGPREVENSLFRASDSIVCRKAVMICKRRQRFFAGQAEATPSVSTPILAG